MMLEPWDLDDMVDAYLECVAWSSTDDDGEPCDARGWKFAPAAVTRAREVCDDFRTAVVAADWGATAVEAWTAEQAGHDLWLTRNHHGAGFWDRYYDSGDRERAGRELTALAHPYGDAYVWANEDTQRLEMEG